MFISRSQIIYIPRISIIALNLLFMFFRRYTGDNKFHSMSDSKLQRRISSVVTCRLCFIYRIAFVAEELRLSLEK